MRVHGAEGSDILPHSDKCVIGSPWRRSVCRGKILLELGDLINNREDLGGVRWDKGGVDGSAAVCEVIVQQERVVICADEVSDPVRAAG